jgi:hypothetical protein
LKKNISEIYSKEKKINEKTQTEDIVEYKKIEKELN